MTRRAVSALDPFEAVVERHGPAVLRFCVARLGHDRGEEAFQETLLAALGHYDELQNPAAVGGWLFSIAQRKIIDTARSRARAPIASDRLEEHAAAWHDPDPTDGIWSQVAALPGKQREAVALRYLADLSHTDIEYFGGRRRSFDVPLDWTLTRAFRRRVLEATGQIAYGQTSSYRQIAVAAGSPNAVRAAGSALATNPLPILVPCHRVLRSDGGLGQYLGGPAAKTQLLTLEKAL